MKDVTQFILHIKKVFQVKKVFTLLGKKVMFVCGKIFFPIYEYFFLTN